MKIRSFLAFDIPGDVKKNLSKIVDDFKLKERAIKWTKIENLHVTMKFFGYIEEEFLINEIVPRIESVTKGFGTSVLQSAGIGVFPNWKYPRVIWAGFTGDTEKVIHLQRIIESALDDFDIHKDKRDFRLHLTLGRAGGRIKNSPLVSVIEKLGPIYFGEVVVDKLVLYKSLLTKKGPIYTPMRGFSLVG